MFFGHMNSMMAPGYIHAHAPHSMSPCHTPYSSNYFCPPVILFQQPPVAILHPFLHLFLLHLIVHKMTVMISERETDATTMVPEESCCWLAYSSQILCSSTQEATTLVVCLIL